MDGTELDKLLGSQEEDFEIAEEDFQDCGDQLECDSSGSEPQNLRTTELSEGSLN